MRLPALGPLLLCALLPTACGGGSSAPSDARVGKLVGPQGGFLVGLTDTSLQGLRIEIPVGALDRLVSLVLEPAPDLAFPGAAPAGPAFRLRAEPEPGLLALPYVVHAPVTLPQFQDGADLALVCEPSDPDIDGTLLPAGLRPCRETDGLDGSRRFFTAEALRFGRCQVLLSERPRNRADSVRLLDQGTAEAARGDFASLEQAISSFAQALEADPFDSRARFRFALARLARLCVDDDDATTSIDSVGELLVRLGFRFGTKGLLPRLLDGDWRMQVRPPADAPGFPTVVDFVDRVLVPELDAIALELDRVGDDYREIVDLGAFAASGLGDREADFVELGTARALVPALRFVADTMARFDWETSLAEAAEKLGPEWSLEDFLALHPSFGTVRLDRRQVAAHSLHRALVHLRQAFVALERETDDQRDDILAFRDELGPQERSTTLAQLDDVLEALRFGTRHGVRLGRQPGTLRVDLRAFLLSSPASPRGVLPPIEGWLPLGRDLPDPGFGGLFPDLGETEAVQRFGLPTRVVLAPADITLDGSYTDWPAASEALLPADLTGEARGLGLTPAVDLHRLWLASDGTTLFVRAELDDDAPGHRSDYAGFYRLRIYDRERGRDDPHYECDVDVSTPATKAWLSWRASLPGVPGAGARVSREGREVPVAFGGRGFELGLPLTLLRGTAGKRERRLRLEVHMLGRSRGETGSDRTRDLLLVF